MNTKISNGKKTNKLCNSEWPHLFGFTTQDVGLFLKISLQFKQLILPFTILQKKYKINGLQKSKNLQNTGFWQEKARECNNWSHPSYVSIRVLSLLTFSFSCSTSLSFLFFHCLNFSESSLICRISCVRWVFIACENTATFETCVCSYSNALKKNKAQSTRDDAMWQKVSVLHAHKVPYNAEEKYVTEQR